MLNPKLEKNTPNLDFWNENIILKGKFHSYLSSLLRDNETNWEELEEYLKKWLKKFKMRLKRYEFEPENKFEQAIKQWKYAAILFTCAKYYAANKMNLNELLKSENLGVEKFNEDTEITITSNILKDIETTSKVCREGIDIDKNKILLLFYSIIQKTKQNSIKIPFVSVNGDDGNLHILELIKINGYGHVGRNPTVFPTLKKYAETDQDFQDSVVAAFELNAENWQNESPKDSRFKKFGVIWDIEPFNKVNTQILQTPIEGTSAGLAALVGIYHLFHDTCPDDRVLFSAAIGFSIENGKNNKRNVVLTNEIKEVEGIPQKLKAAIKNDYIDTFVFHEENFTDDLKKIIDEVNSKGKSFRIKTINSNGEEKMTYTSVG